jgi:hypothetical protein|uniref:Uncharacterized protein n=1 Tax=viral metagenome TaxID=1070528 RepID=A0A6C0BAA2_9ZZZZ
MPSLKMYPITHGINNANFRKGGSSKKHKKNKKNRTRRK